LVEQEPLIIDQAKSIKQDLIDNSTQMMDLEARHNGGFE
jgi:hypothetical protein